VNQEFYTKPQVKKWIGYIGDLITFRSKYIITLAHIHSDNKVSSVKLTILKRYLRRRGESCY
jgi:hypothetical protein